jgi:hypothetical protein
VRIISAILIHYQIIVTLTKRLVILHCTSFFCFAYAASCPTLLVLTLTLDDFAHTYSTPYSASTSMRYYLAATSCFTCGAELAAAPNQACCQEWNTRYR